MSRLGLLHRLDSSFAPLFPTLVGLLIAGLMAGCSASDPEVPEKMADEAPEVAEATLELFDETLELEEGGTVSYERGVVTVPVRRDDAASGTMQVEFFRFPRSAQASPETPPIFLLRGGPGFGGLGPALERPGYFENRLARLTHLSDLIVPGQRGFGSSGATPCEPMKTLTPEEALDEEVLLQTLREGTSQCREKWEAEGFDLTGLTVVEAAGDIVDIARLLDYPEIQLRGGSFGSHWAMTIMRDHPDLIARATLTGLEGPDHTYDMPSGVLAAMERIAKSAEASPALAARIPEGGILAAYRGLIARAEAEPIAVDVEAPETGDKITLQLDGDAFRNVLAQTRNFTSLRVRVAPWPLRVLDVLEGDFEAAAEGYLEDLLETYLPDAAFFQLDCGSGLSQERGEQLRNDPAADMIGPIWLWYDTSCAAWDADLGEDFRSPFTTSIPTVLVQGNWDTSTPYENALELRSFFQNHRFVHVEGGSHGALREALEEVDGFEAAMDRWLATGDFEQIPESVELPTFPWSAEEEEGDD